MLFNCSDVERSGIVMDRFFRAASVMSTTTTKGHHLVKRAAELPAIVAAAFLPFKIPVLPLSNVFCVRLQKYCASVQKVENCTTARSCCSHCTQRCQSCLPALVKSEERRDRRVRPCTPKLIWGSTRVFMVNAYDIQTDV